VETAGGDLPLSALVRVADAAQELKVSERRVRQLIARGQIRAAKVTPRLYLVTQASLDAYKVSRRGPGRPRKKE
jgi:excisionase family DNA binding protein